MSHTKGPWFVASWEFKNGDKKLFGFTVRTDYEASGQIEADNNARLISAAPDLLEALEGALKNVVGFSHGQASNKEYKEYLDSIELARAAIAKAKGLKP